MDTIVTTIAPPRGGTTEIDLCAWLGQAAPDDALEYHRGFLALDASLHGGSLGDHERRELGRVARRALWAADRGLAHLVQRRYGPFDYGYLVIRTTHRPVSGAALSGALMAEVSDDR